MINENLFTPCIETFLCIGNKKINTIVNICKDTNRIYITVTKHKNILIDLELIKSSFDKKDTRKQILNLTEKGNHFLQLLNSLNKLLEDK